MSPDNSPLLVKIDSIDPSPNKKSDRSQSVVIKYQAVEQIMESKDEEDGDKS